MMRAPWRVVIGAAVVLFVLAGASLVTAYKASRHVPDFYSQALAIDAGRQVQASREMEARVSTLYSEARNRGRWHALFTDEQINGWLAVDLAREHGDLMAENIHDPRVGIEPDMITLALRMNDENVSTVISLGIEVYLTKPNVLAFRIRKARAGALPLPLTTVIDEVNWAADDMDVPLRWTQEEGDPVALVELSPQRDADDNVLLLEKLELRSGAVYLAGRTVPAAQSPPVSKTSTVMSGILLALLQEARRR